MPSTFGKTVPRADDKPCQSWRVWTWVLIPHVWVSAVVVAVHTFIAPLVHLSASMAAAAPHPAAFAQPQFLEVHLPFTQLPACLAGCTLWADASTSSTPASSQQQHSPGRSSSSASKQSGFRFDKALSKGIAGAADAPACSARGDGRFDGGAAFKKQ